MRGRGGRAVVDGGESETGCKCNGRPSLVGLGWGSRGTSGRGMMGEGTWGMYIAGEAAQYGYPFPGNLGLGHQQSDGQGRAVELGSGGGDLLWLTRAPAWDGLCAVRATLWAGAREEGRSPSQGLAKGTFSDSVTATATAAAGTYRIRYKSTANRYVPMGMYLDTPFRYVPVHIRHGGHVPMYPAFESRGQQQRAAPDHPSPPIPSHPTRPCPGWDNVISPDSIGCWPSNTQST